MDPLVSPQWLAATIGDPVLRIIDVSWHLPGDGRDARAEHAAAHIPGGVFLDLAALADAANPVPMMLPPPAEFAARLGALGIGDGCRIVLYDDSPYHTAARGWVTLRAYGIESVAILDGGLAGWRAEGLLTESGPVTVTPATLTPRAAGAGIVDLAAVRDAMDDYTVQIVDARGAARFAGEEPEPRPGVVPGHIPGARNLPYPQLFKPDGRWKRGDRLRAAFVEAGIDPDAPVVATCGSGVTASVIVFALHLLGRDAALYDGSWGEWGADPATPKATGRA